MTYAVFRPECHTSGAKVRTRMSSAELAEQQTFGVAVAQQTLTGRRNQLSDRQGDTSRQPPLASRRRQPPRYNPASSMRNHAVVCPFWEDALVSFSDLWIGTKWCLTTNHMTRSASTIPSSCLPIRIVNVPHSKRFGLSIVLIATDRHLCRRRPATKKTRKDVNCSQ